MNQSNYSIQDLQASALQVIGQKLLQTREQRERQLEDIALKTHIPVAQLAALEAADLTQLPSPDAIQPLIRQYANVLGLNGLKLANAFPLVLEKPPGWSWWQKYCNVRLSPLQLYAVYIVMTIGMIQSLSLVLRQPDSSGVMLPRLSQSTSQETAISQSPNE